jgi:hypothetical protein
MKTVPVPSTANYVWCNYIFYSIYPLTELFSTSHNKWLPQPRLYLHLPGWVLKFSDNRIFVLQITEFSRLCKMHGFSLFKIYKIRLQLAIHCSWESWESWESYTVCQTATEWSVNGISIISVPCTVHLLLFCIMTNQCTIISQIITPLHVSTLSCHPQTACNQYLAQLHRYVKCSFW